jgi:hypothetical protein
MSGTLTWPTSVCVQGFHARHDLLLDNRTRDGKVWGGGTTIL